MAPLISIVLPFYNAEDTLACAIDSILNQTHENFQLILVDDGSTDGGPSIARGSATRDSRVQVVSGPHQGIVPALRRGCSAAAGEFIARMDADDVSLPDRLAAQAELVIQDQGIALCGTLVRIVGDGVASGRRRYEEWINGLVHSEDIERELFVECPIPHPTFMMRRSAYEALGGYEDHGWAEDYDLVMRASLAGMKMAKAPRVLLDWSHRGARLSMNDDRYSVERFRALKRHYLFESYLSGREVFYQWGAGEVGKPWLREWGPRRPTAVVDINPRKIGREIHGIPVISPDELPGPGEMFTVVAVGTPGARDEIRAWFASRGCAELRDFIFVA